MLVRMFRRLCCYRDSSISRSSRSLSRRSDDFHTLRRMSLVGSTLAEVQLCSTPLEPPSVEPSDDS